MKPTVIFLSLVFLSIPVLTAVSKNGDSPLLKGDYLGQEPPGTSPKLFAPGVISTDAPEGCLTFSHDGDYAVFRRHWREDTKVFILERKNGEWTRPEIAPFFREGFGLGDFTFAPNEAKLYFTSNRPLDGGDEENESSDLWMVENVDNSWLAPVHLGTSVNSALHDSYPSVANDKTIYFFRRFEGDEGLSEILYAPFRDGDYSEPMRLEGDINTQWDEWDPAISPDGRILVFCSKRPSGLGKDDLYVSFKDRNGRWSNSTNLGDRVNSPNSENRPFITSDGKYLFFNSDSGGSRDIYWIDMEVVRRLDPLE